MIRRASRASAVGIGCAALALSVWADPAVAQAVPDSRAVAATPPQAVVTRILAIGSLTAKVTPASLASVLQREVPPTLKLYLSGKIADWYVKADQTGVVFILNVTTVEEARALLEPLPLGQAGMMTFQLTRLGPLQPLGILLRQPAQ